jgi:PAS domain S-box-containing protein
MAEVSEARAELERLKAEFEDFLYYLPDGFIEVDLATQRVTRANREACLNLGYDPERPPLGIHGGELLGEGELPRLWARHLSFIQPYLEQGVPYRRSDRLELVEARARRRDGTEFPAEFQASYVLGEKDFPTAIRFIFRDVSERKAVEAERAERLRQLERLLPICAWCNRIREEGGEWQQLEAYVSKHAGYDFTHSICPDCEARMNLSPIP